MEGGLCCVEEHGKSLNCLLCLGRFWKERLLHSDTFLHQHRQARGLRRGLSDTRKSDLYIPAEFLQRRRLGAKNPDFKIWHVQTLRSFCFFLAPHLRSGSGRARRACPETPDIWPTPLYCRGMYTRYTSFYYFNI